MVMMRKSFLALAVLCGLLSVGSAANAQAPAPSAPAAAGASDDYRLGPADKIRITVYDEPGLTNDYSVTSDGAISFPMIDNVKAANRTVGEVREEIRAKLTAFIRNPSVSAEVLTFRPFYVIGEVNRPGSFPYTSGLTVDKAVATASGYTYRANKRVVFIKRADQSKEAEYPLTGDTVVQPGDVIRIAERHF